MNAITQTLVVAALLLGTATVTATTVGVELAPESSNPANPTMGDWMRFRSVIRNNGTHPVEGLVAWISLVQVTPGHEQPMDLEDWSAHKAVTGTTLAAGAAVTTQWPMRLIRSGDYRVVISTTDRNEKTVFTSPTIEFHVAQKAVIESKRILPVAIGVPLFLVGLLIYRARRGHTGRAVAS